jgi:hypothetical protein
MAVVETARPAPTPDALASLTSSLPHSLTHRSLSQDGRCASPPIVFAASLPPLHCSLSGAPTAAGRYTAGLPINESNRAMNDCEGSGEQRRNDKAYGYSWPDGSTAWRCDDRASYIKLHPHDIHNVIWHTLHYTTLTHGDYITLHYIQAYIQDMTLCFSLWYVM